MKFADGPGLGDRLEAAKSAAEEDLLLGVMSQGLKMSSATEGLGLDNIVGVGVPSRSEEGDVVAVYVAHKVMPELIDGGAMVPATYEGVPTKVIETGEFVSYTGQGRHRPAPLGVSIGHLDGQTGTLGFLGTRGGELYVVSNNHVLARENRAKKGDPILQPGPYDNGGASDRFAELAEWLPLDFSGERNRIDAAIARVDEVEVSNQLLEGGPLEGLPAEVRPNIPVRKCGRTTGLTQGVLYDISATIKLRYPSGMALLADQVLIRGLDGRSFSDGGDSGSLIVEDGSNRPVALLCGGSGRFTVASKIEAVLDGLGVSWLL